MKALKVLIVEDEPQARRIMEKLLARHFPDITVLGSCASVKGTLEWLAAHDGSSPDRPAPDLIFMDVELQDGNCFELFERTEIRAHVIMTTAYDNYAVKAFEINSLDYLLKPIEAEDLKRAVARAESARSDVPAPPPASPAPLRERFLIRLNDRIVPVRTQDIIYLHSEAKNSYITTRDGSSYVSDESLDSLEGELDPTHFFRIPRSCILADHAVGSISKLLGGRLRVVLPDGLRAHTDLTVSRARVDGFLAWLER